MDNNFNYGLVNVTGEEFLLIIDGSSLLSTQFYGNLPREIMFAKTTEEKEKHFGKIMQTKAGVYTNAIYGFLRVMLKLIKEQKPTYLAVAWDVTRNTFRKELYEAYKGNRSETLAPLKSQFILCQEVLKDMNILQFMSEKFEADDYCGTLARKFEQDVYVRIMTKDNDYLQLVTDRTNIWMLHSTQQKTEEMYDKYGIDHKKLNSPDRTFQFTPELVEKEFMVKPASINSLKGIQGDASDNIKGVPGVGKDTAAALIAKYENVDKLYGVINALDEKGRKALGEEWKATLGIKRSPMNNLIKTSDEELVGEKAARLSEKLATIVCDIPLDVTLDDLRINIDETGAYKRFAELEFKSLLNSLQSGAKDKNIADADGFVSSETSPFDDNPFMNEPVDDNETMAGGSSQGTPDKDTISGDRDDTVQTAEVRIINIPEESLYSYAEADSKGKLNEFFDRAGKGEHISIYPVMEDGYYAGCMLTDKSGNIFVPEQAANLGYIAGKLTELAKKEVRMAVYDIKNMLDMFDGIREYFDEKNEQSIQEWFDVMIAAYLINPITGSYPLEELAVKYTESRLEKLPKESLMLLMTLGREETLKSYAARSMVIYHLYDAFSENLKLQNMESLMYDMEMPLAFVLYDMQKQGIAVKKEELDEYAAGLYVNIERLEKEIYESCGETFNINSPKQLGVILFEKLNLTNGKKTKTGYSTSADVLEKIRSEHPVVEKILEYRQLTKLHSTYAVGLAQYISEDGRIHGTFNQTVTATGRISSTEPNLQNIPIRLELGRQIRKVFVPEDGNVFLDADYSQIELRVLAHMSGDEELIKAYHSGRDIHAVTASQVFHVPFDEVTKELRSRAKAVNFGIVYGISSFGLGNDLNISQKEAKEYIEKYFETYPGVKKFLDGLISNSAKSGYVATLYNRRRPVPELNSSNYIRRSAEERITMNTPVQGTAADIIKLAMIRVYKRLKDEKLDAALLVQIHDELLVEASKKDAPAAAKVMQEEMEKAVQLLVPLIAEVNTGNNWYESK